MTARKDLLPRMNSTQSSLSFCFDCRKWVPSRSRPSQSSPHPAKDQSKSDRQGFARGGGDQCTSPHLCPLPLEPHQRCRRIYGMEIHKYYKAGLFSRELIIKHLSQQHEHTGGQAAYVVTCHQEWGWLGSAHHSFPFHSTCSLPPLTGIDLQ